LAGLPANKEENSLNRGLLGRRCSADRTRLHAISLLSGNLTGNSAILRHLETVLAQETAVLQPLIEQFPTQLTGKLFRGQGFLVQQQGIYLQIYNRNDDALSAGRKAVMGALSLYLNFINLFMLMLRLAGVRLAPEVGIPSRSGF
jgi:hypothetical protein